MALKGTFHFWANHSNEYNTEKITIEHPSDLPEGHPDYEKKGTSEEVESKTPILTSVDYENAYANISQVTVNRRFVYNLEGDLVKIYEIQYTIYVFETKQEYEEGSTPIYQYPVHNALYEGNHNNIFEYAYSLLKQRQGFEDMVNDI